MDIERQKTRVSHLTKEIDLLARHDKRNAWVKKRMMENLRKAKLMEAGALFEQAGILDRYDGNAVLSLLEKEKENITRNMEE